MKLLIFVLIILGIIILWPEAWENVQTMLDSFRNH